MTNPLYTVDQLPQTSAAAIRVFDERYLAALAAVQPEEWCSLGDIIDTDSPFLTFPVSAVALKYQKTEGESRFKTRKELSFDLKVEEFDEGVEAKMIDLATKVYAYRAWTQSPSQLLIAEAVFRNKSIATLLEAGTTTDCFDGAKFFATNHPANPFESVGTFSNYQSSTKDCADIDDLAGEVSAMQAGVLDMNGEKMGADPDTLLVPVEKKEAVKNMLSQNFIPNSSGNGTQTNPYFGSRFNVVAAPQLTDTNDWYLVDSKLMSKFGMAPWLMARYRAPGSLGLRTFDESSDFFKNTGKIKVSSHVWYGFSLGFPHAIRLVKGA